MGKYFEDLKPVHELLEKFKNCKVEIVVRYESLGKTFVPVYRVTARLRFEDMEKLKMMFDEIKYDYVKNISMYFFHENLFQLVWVTGV